MAVGKISTDTTVPWRCLSFLSKVADFDPPHLHLALQQGVIPVEFREDLWLQTTRVPGLSYGVVRVILRLAVLVEHRLVTDRRTDTRRKHIQHIHRAVKSKAVSKLRNVLNLSY